MLKLLRCSNYFGAQITFSPVGEFPNVGHHFACSAHAVSTNGVAVGETNHTPLQSVAWRWASGTGLENHGNFPVGGTRALAFGISDDGKWTCGSGGTNLNVSIRASLWSSATGMFPIGGPRTESRAVNNDGTVALVNDLSSPRSAMIWDATTGLTTLPGIAPFSPHDGRAISGDGSIVAGWSGSNFSQAWIWTAATGTTPLTPLSGAPDSRAYCMTTDGTMVAGFVGDMLLGFFPITAARGTTLQTPESLGSLPGTSYSQANGISDDGSVIVGLASGPSSKAFLWIENQGMLDLQNYLVSNGVTGPTGWQLWEANDISADGRFIVGRGINPSGVSEGYVVDLGPSTTTISAYCTPMDPYCTGVSTQLDGSTGSGIGANLHLSATSGPSGQFGYLLIGDSLLSPGTSLGNGRLCIGGQIGRYNVVGSVLNSRGQFDSNGDFANLAGSGTSQNNFGFDVPAAAPFGAPLTGSTWYFQLWHRDSCANGSNFSNAFQATLL